MILRWWENGALAEERQNDRDGPGEPLGTGLVPRTLNHKRRGGATRVLHSGGCPAFCPAPGSLASPRPEARASQPSAGLHRRSRVRPQLRYAPVSEESFQRCAPSLAAETAITRVDVSCCRAHKRPRLPRLRPWRERVALVPVTLATVPPERQCQCKLPISGARRE